MEAYLDNSATTRCSKAAADLMMELLTQEFGNPSSLHKIGIKCEKRLTQCREYKVQ